MTTDAVTERAQPVVAAPPRRLRAVLTQETIATSLASLLVGVAVILPLVTLVVSSFRVLDAFGFETTWGLDNYRTLVRAGNDGAAGIYETKRIELSLFDMENNELETTNVIAKFPKIAARLQELAERHRREFYPDQV